MKLLVLACIIALANADSPNIPVSAFGGTMYLDAEEILEGALKNSLFQTGVVDVDVDSIQYDNTGYVVRLFSRQPLGSDFQSTLEKVLRSDLGFSDVTVKSQPLALRYNRFPNNGNIGWYGVYFNPATVVQNLAKLGKEVMATTNISLEDSLWD